MNNMAKGQSLYDYLNEEVTEDNFIIPNNKPNWTIEKEIDWKKHIKEEWTGFCVDDGKQHSMMSITSKTGMNFYWKCSKCGSIYEKTLHDKVGHKYGCPYCRNIKANNTNNLYNWCMKNGDLGQEILEQWTGIQIDKETSKILKENVDIKKETFSSHKYFMWKCKKCGTEWSAMLYQRTHNNTGCPGKCLGIKQSIHEKERKVIQGVNDLETYFNSDDNWARQLIQEWLGLDEQGNITNTTRLAINSHGKYWWKCENGHEYTASLSSRISHHTGCPQCNFKGTSYPEQYIRWALQQVFSQTASRQAVLKSKENPSGYEFDIAIVFNEEQKKKYKYPALCIEYSPTRWHGGNNRDNKKIELCKKYGVRLIYIMEDTDNEYEEKWEPDFICFSMKNYNKDDVLKKIVIHILESLEHSIDEIDINEVKNNAYKYSHGKIDYAESICCKYPELVKEYSDKNNISPLNITKGSYIKPNWRCIKCGYTWNNASVHDRIRSHSGCPKCGYNWYKAQTGQQQKYREYLSDTKYSELAKEYSELNNVSINEVLKSSGINYYFECTNCGFGGNGEWTAKPNRRTAKGYETGCPNCGYNWYKAQTGQPQKLKTYYIKYNKSASI